MPTWLVHGFRWPRNLIRAHVILQNLDDAAPEWLMAPATTACLAENFREQWPDQIAQISDLRFIEQYNPEDLTSKDQPYAFVCDAVHEVHLNIDIEDVQESSSTDDRETAISQLRDKVAPGEKLGWFVVTNGDVERQAPPIDSEDSDPIPSLNPINSTGELDSLVLEESNGGQEPERLPIGRSLKNWVGERLKRTKSMKDLKTNMRAKEVIPSLHTVALMPSPQSTSNS